MGMTQRKALRIGRRHQKEGEHSQRCMPAFSAARVPSAAHTHSPAAMAMPRLIATAYDGLVAGTPVWRVGSWGLGAARMWQMSVSVHSAGVQVVAALDEVAEFCFDLGQLAAACADVRAVVRLDRLRGVDPQRLELAVRPGELGLEPTNARCRALDGRVRRADVLLGRVVRARVGVCGRDEPPEHCDEKQGQRPEAAKRHRHAFPSGRARPRGTACRVTRSGQR